MGEGEKQGETDGVKKGYPEAPSAIEIFVSKTICGFFPESLWSLLAAHYRTTDIVMRV